MLGVEAGGRGKSLGEHAARLAAAEGFTGARPGVLQGTYTYVLQTADGQIATTHSVSAGLDYPAVGPRARLARRSEARRIHRRKRRRGDSKPRRRWRVLEGIIPALESAHAMAELIERAPKMEKDEIVILNLSGRGDKDMETLSRYV